MNIGIAGVGRMGSAIVRRLLDQGYDITIWNRTPGRTDELQSNGATVASTPAELAHGVDVIITILTNAAAIDSVYSEVDGLLSGSLAGKLVIDMSTVRPETTRALAVRVRGKGSAFVECPVGGTVAPALAGKLIGLAGGETEDVERARPLLETLCRRVEHVGPAGCGASVKLAINLPLAVYWQALGEAMVLCQEVGLEPERIVDIFADTSAGPSVMKTRAEIVARALAGENFPGTFDVDQLRKDLRTMLAEADEMEARLPVATATLAAYDESAQDGLGGADGSVHSAYWRDHAKV